VVDVADPCGLGARRVLSRRGRADPCGEDVDACGGGLANDVHRLDRQGLVGFKESVKIRLLIRGIEWTARPLMGLGVPLWTG
jgi:hypothetical protein